MYKKMDALTTYEEIDRLKKDIKNTETKINKVRDMVVIEQENGKVSEELLKTYRELINRLKSKQEDLDKCHKAVCYRPNPIKEIEKRLRSVEKNHELIETLNNTIASLNQLTKNMVKAIELDCSSQVYYKDILSSIEIQTYNLKELIKRTGKKLNREVIEKELKDKVRDMEKEREDRIQEDKKIKSLLSD